MHGNGTATPQLKETQYQFEMDLVLKHGFARFGIMSNQTWRDDPRRLLFLLSRYKFVAKIARSLTATGTAIIGSPSLQSQAYASPPSKEGHVNCMDGLEYKKVMLRHFDNVFLFSMNDEMVHTGYHPMAHYLLALCVG